MAIKSVLAATVAALALSACASPRQQAAAPSSGVTAQNSQRARALLQQGVRAYSHHSYKIAHGYFSQALAADASNADALYDRAVTSERLKAYGSAQSDLRRLVKQRPGWVKARMHLASAEYFNHRFDLAARDFDIALRAQNHDWKAWLDDGVAYYRLNRFNDARKRIAKALDIRPRSGLAHLWLGMTYERLGSKSKARTELALAAHSRDPRIRQTARKRLSG